MKRKHLFSLPLIFLAAFLLAPEAHAFITGTVCVADGSSTNCPSSPPTFTGSTGSQLTVAVNAQGSDSMQGFDIRVQTDSSVLNPTGVAVEGNVLSTFPGSMGIFWFGCINGTPTNSTSPNGCATGIDGPGVVRVIATGLGCCGTTVPTTGRLFSITFTIVSGSSSASISFPTGPAGAAGCDPSSVTGTTTCIQVSNGSGQIIPEIAQTANFGTAPPPPDFSISASSGSLTVSRGTPGQVTITVTSLNGFTGTVSLSATVSPTVKRGPTASLNPTGLTLTANGQATSTLTVTTVGGTPPGTYTVTVTGTGNGLTRQTQITLTVIRH